MARKPTYEELEQRVKELEQERVERKRAEAALLESEAFTSSLLENSPIPMAVADQDTSLRYVNPMYERAVGYSSAEILGKKVPYPWWTGDPESGNVAEREEDVLTGAREE